ncbi:uncharacterized protein UHOD_12228 [Ustilago sp. UG-2017b]|nr:uncharacterized protein UHOD_12228 [Ustilago sp. UG-2017b]
MTPRSGVSVDDEVGGVGGNSMVSTRVSSVLTNACSDPWTAVDYCLRFYLYPDRWSAMNRLRMSLSESTLFIEYCTGGGCHGPECTGSMKAVGSYGRSKGTKGRVTEEDDHSRPRGGQAEARGLAGTGSRNG